MILNAFLDFFSVASFLPLILFIVKPDFISNNELTSQAYDFFGFTSATSFIVVVTAGVFLLMLVKNLINAWIANLKVNFAFALAHDLSSRVTADYLKMPYSKFSQVDFTGELNRMVNHPLSFANSIIVPITVLICEILIISLFLIWMAYYDLRMLMVLGGVLLPVIIIYQFGKKNLKQIGESLKLHYRATMKSALQIVEAFTEIKTYGKESFFHQKFQSVNRDLTLMSKKDKSLQTASTRMIEIVVAMLICLIIIYTVSVREDYQQTLLLLAVYIGASFRMIPSANRVLYALQQLRMNVQLLDELGGSQDSGSIFTHTSPPLTFNRDIKFRNVSFKYPEGPVALSNISLTIRKGEKIAITGNSGEGKTTFLLVLLRLLRETEGQVLVDDDPLTDVSGWRKISAYVPQDPYIMDGTLCENIAFGISRPEMDQSQVLQIIDRLGLHDLVRQLPKGIESRIGERGAKLSGGQKQRIAIARALYADAEIIILDEATNQLQASLESEVMDLLDHVAGNKTIIMVTHKVRTNFFDAIYYLENGKLANISEKNRLDSSLNV